MPSLHPGQAFLDLAVLAAFLEVFLAKEGHAGCIGINLLEKIQLPTLPTLYGAMLAGVSFGSKADSEINLWDIQSGHLLRRLQVSVFKGRSWDLAFFPDGRTLATTVSSGVQLWRIK